MSTALTLPGAARPTAHDRFKQRYRAISGEALILATLIHAALLLWFPALRAPDVSWVAAELSIVELPPEVEIPPPPQTIARPATPIVSASAEVAEDLTIAFTTFDAQPAAALPPPPQARAGEPDDLAAAPVFTPYTVSPRLLNRSAVAAELVRVYPRLHREAGIGGVALLWFFIDQEGRVVRTQVKQSSGHDALDRAALQVAGVMEFSPAMNRDKRVPVWVQIPVSFEVRRR